MLEKNLHPVGLAKHHVVGFWSSVGGRIWIWLTRIGVCSKEVVIWNFHTTKRDKCDTFTICSPFFEKHLGDVCMLSLPFRKCWNNVLCCPTSMGSSQKQSSLVCSLPVQTAETSVRHPFWSNKQPGPASAMFSWSPKTIADLWCRFFFLAVV